MTLTGHSYGVTSIVFSPNGEYLASGSFDSCVGVWKMLTGERVETFIGHTDDVRTVMFSPDGNFVASGSDDCSVYVWKV